jgi:hypothetical protein
MIAELRRKLKTLAMLDAIMEPEWQYRYFSYNSKWSETAEMGSLRDGSGGEWFLWTSDQLAGYKCLSPDDGLMKELENEKAKIPDIYGAFVTESAFGMDHATCIWYLDELKWVKLGLPVKWLIDLETVSKWHAKDYHAWAIDYYERDIDLSVIEKLFAGKFSDELALGLNPEINMSELKEELKEIGIYS